MRHHEFYIKYKIYNQSIRNSIFSKRNWWRIVLITAAAALIQPLVIMYKHQRSVPFSFHYYIELAEYFLLFVVPFVAFLFWINWRESIKRKRGYGWVGKFEVIEKRSVFAFHYFLLAPGKRHRIKVNQRLFEKTKVGDFILIRRDALGGIKEVSRINNFSRRIAKSWSRRPTKTDRDLLGA